jgi:phosphatidylserine decarboxylase
MASSVIRYFDRSSRTVKTEKIYGEAWMRLIYGNPLGRMALWLVVRRAFFSRFYGWKMNWRSSALQVLPFIAKYNVDVDEFAKSAFDYKTFNEFFCRALKPSARPIAPGDKVAIFPADGRHLAFPDVARAGGFYVKGATFTPADLLGAEGEKFAGGAMLISRLCPTDYHRFHFPVGGVVGATTETPGWLYSVSPLALRRRLRYLLENKRQMTLIESPDFGTVAMVEIGATNVGSILQNHIPGQPVNKGEEKGLFSFGGSCVVTFFQRGRIVFDADIVGQSENCVETYARMGDRLGAAP